MTLDTYSTSRPRSPLGGVIAILALGSILASPASAVTIGFDPATQSVALGDAVQVDLVISDLGGEIISAYDLDLTYDPTVVDATGVTFTMALGDELFFETFNAVDLSSSGVVDLAQLSLLSDAELAALQPGDSVEVATLHFDTVGAGTTHFGFVFDDFNDVKGLDGGVLPIVEDAGSITVRSPSEAPIPEPSAAILFVAGAMLVRRRVRRRANAPRR